MAKRTSVIGHACSELSAPTERALSPYENPEEAKRAK